MGTIVRLGALCLLILSGSSAVGTQDRAAPRGDADVRRSVLRWNRIAMDASGIDHMHPAPGDPRVLGEQLGPGRSARAMAIVHIAMFEVVNADAPFYRSYTSLSPTARVLNLPAAIAQAAHDTLASLFPSQARSFEDALSIDLLAMPRGGAFEDGVELGRESARLILALRANDGSRHAEPRVGIDFFPSPEPGHWRPDPMSASLAALGAEWGQVQPFVLDRPDQFRAPPPPALTSAEYAEAFNEVKALGGDGAATPSVRTQDETMIGVYWAYDGMPSLCAPPRLYNQLAVTVAKTQGSDALELSRLLALVNVAMADAGIGIWESKYHYDFWRPVTAVREADAGAGPMLLGDGNPYTTGDATFTPLGAPSSNLNGPNFTPPFPAYPSGHAGFGGALFQILRDVYGRDDIAFTFVSDEFNGETIDNGGRVRPLIRRSFTSLSQAEEENGQSRIYLGIHWSFDKTAGIAQGRQIANVVFQHLFTPIRDTRR